MKKGDKVKLLAHGDFGLFTVYKNTRITIKAIQDSTVINHIVFMR